LPAKTSILLERATLLEPHQGVVKDGDAFVAHDPEPWLRFKDVERFRRSRFLEIRYETDAAQPPCRPLLRFLIGPDKIQDHILPAPVRGIGVWIGRAPRHFTDVWISPVNHPGRFVFEITEIARAPHKELVRRLSRAPKRLFFAVSAGLVGLEDEADLNWRWALGTAPSDLADADRGQRTKTQFEALEQKSPGHAPRCWIYVDVASATADEIDVSCASLQEMANATTRIRLHGAPAAAALERKRHWETQPGFAAADPGETPDDSDLVARIAAGDRLTRDALALLGAHMRRHPDHALVYADEIRSTNDGSRAPYFKPGWSPTLQRSTRYVGWAAFFMARFLSRQSDWMTCDPAELVDRIASEASHSEVGSIRAPLFETPARRLPPVPPIEMIHGSLGPLVSVVIPTRDKPELLRNCLESLFALTSYPNYEVVLVDNDSVDPRATELIEKLQLGNDRLRVMRIPGEFNFSALSNAGAEASKGEYLLFLNNDTRVVSSDWIERLLYFATQPDIGAVGAKLLYPNRKTQHVGVLLGMGGVAGHFGAGLDETAPGWLGRNLVPHEVSAVTGACLMVERGKFETVGRFDDVNLPVDLNDVDLCLRLGARGWRTICNSQVVLIHHQSASRGGSMRLQQVYERERRFFLERWRWLIRDDPYFHPALSLYSTVEAAP